MPGLRPHEDRGVRPQHARRLEAAHPSGDELAGLERAASAAVAAGIDPATVADHVAGAIDTGEFWILPHRYVAVRTTEQRLGWLQGGSAATIDLDKATRGG